MRRKNLKKLSAAELLELISNQWADKTSIQLIAGIGESKAFEVLHEIRGELISQGYRLPPYVVPMEKVVEYYNLNINYLKKVSR